MVCQFFTLLCQRKIWVTFIFILLCVLSVISVIIQMQHPMYFRKFRRAKTSRACTSHTVLKEIVELTNDVHITLTKLNITHFLLYGSHWGAIRMSGPLSWDDDADIGMIAEDSYFALTQNEFIRTFEHQGITVKNNIAQKTSLMLTRGLPNVDVIVFYNYNGLMQRKGWETFLTPIHYRLHHSFPTRLVKTPPQLPTMKFGQYYLPVPRGGLEIMKSLYSHDWWKKYKPDTNCETIKW